MSVKKLSLLDEGSWALMIEESNVRALHRYHGSMAGLNIDYYLSIGTGRYYKGYFEETGLARVRDGIVRFLHDDATYRRCVARIHEVLERMRRSDVAFAGLDLSAQFDLYCELLCEYIAYYNSVITDAFYHTVFDLVDAGIPARARFAIKEVKDALFATDNNDLLTHGQTVDMLALARKHLAGHPVDEEVAQYVDTYRSTTISSANPGGITAAEIADHLARQTRHSVEIESAFLDNLHFRYRNAGMWSARTAAALGLDGATMTLIQRTGELSYLKIKMREEFQKFKVTTRSRFLTALIKRIGKQQFDYMRIGEIAAFIRDGTRVSEAELAKRRNLTVFELKDGDVELLDAVPPDADIVSDRDPTRHELAGDVLIGAGTKRYRVLKVEQHEEGLTSFDEFIETTADKESVAVLTNVLRPYLVPKLRKFGALLTQYGGYTSHASVLCRELGINSMIGVNGLLDALKTDDRIEIDFDAGTIRKRDETVPATPAITDVVIDLFGDRPGTKRDVGAKAANLMKISKMARIADGFVITSHACRNIDDPAVRDAILDRLAALKSARVVIRSSHESEDGGQGSYAGLFESYVDIDTADTGRVIELVRSVYRSQRADSVDRYATAEGDMSVIVQELISPDVSGVVLTSNPSDGYDYLLLEYVVGDLWHLMQGDVTPLRAYIRKVDIIDGDDDYAAYPAVVTESLAALFKPLAGIAIDLEREFLRRVQIEWGIRDETIYVFQVRPY